MANGSCRPHGERRRRASSRKRVDAPYVPGDRGVWRKAKCYQREEFVIVGYSEPEGSRSHIGALLLAYYDDGGKLIAAVQDAYTWHCF